MAQGGGANTGSDRGDHCPTPLEQRNHGVTPDELRRANLTSSLAVEAAGAVRPRRRKS